jgi:hypothetical protein
MPRTAPISVVALFVLAAVTLSACGGESATTGSAGSPTAAGSTSASGTAGDSASTAAMVVVRSGGFAGVFDRMRIAADGTASITAKTGRSRACTPTTTALDRLRAIDLAAVTATASGPLTLADGFTYSVRSATTAASAREGDDDSRRAAFVKAAAAVIASCLATRS